MRVVSFVLALAFVSLGGAAAAAPHRVTYSPIDLAEGALSLPEDVEFDDSEAALLSFGPGGGKCDVTVSGGELKPATDGGCPQLFAIPEPRTVDAELSGDGDAKVALSFVPKVTGSPVRLLLKGSQVTMPSGFPPDVSQLAVLEYDGPAASAKPTGWKLLTVEESGITLEGTTAEVAKARAGQYRVYGLEAAEDGSEPRVWEFQIMAGGAGVTTGPQHSLVVTNPDPNVPPEPLLPEDPTGDPGDPGPFQRLQALPPGTAVPPELQCPPAKLPHEDMIVVCVDATGRQITYRMVPEGTRLTKPNRYFYVHVVHHQQYRVSMDMGGQIGSYVPGTRGKFEVSGGGGRAFDGQMAEEVTLIASARTFAPRRPGFAPLVVRLFDDQRQLPDPLVIEFWIDETYSGAFRVGLAGIFLGGVEQQYSKVTRPNSQTEEIAATGENLLDIDLMLGYSPYLDSGGRAATGCENAPFCFEPYFGLGILNADGAGGIDWLKSVHLGVEWELTPEFAIGLTANVRRVSRLAEGQKPGYPVDGEIPKEDRYVFGVGLIVNLSPSFLRIGAGGAAALLK